jgi:hypothetical protein
MRVLMISLVLALASSASAQDQDRGWKWETPGADTGTDGSLAAPDSVLDRLQQPTPEAPAAHQERREKWLERFDNRGRGGSGGEGGGGDSGGGGGHG